MRLAQELANITTALPSEHTNSIFVRCDQERVDFIQAIIMGSNGTPYAHGAFLVLDATGFVACFFPSLLQLGR